MPGFRLPGPLCGSAQSWWLRDGTSALWSMPPPQLLLCTPLDAGLPFMKPVDVGFLFNQCRAPERGITDKQYEDAAKQIDGVDVETIKAVAEVETAGAAFDDDGRPRILFERHYFHRLTGGRFDKAYPRISAKSSGGYGKFREQYTKLEQAYRLDQSAALQSASWGRFQIMGEHYHEAGFGSVEEFVLAMSRSEAEQLTAFVKFVKGNPKMAKALKDKDWAAFARAYNGKGYKKNDYDTKLKKAYDALVAARPKPAPTPGPAPRLP